jgi:hypothetical protein
MAPAPSPCASRRPSSPFTSPATLSFPLYPLPSPSPQDQRDQLAGELAEARAAVDELGALLGEARGAAAAGAAAGDAADEAALRVGWRGAWAAGGAGVCRLWLWLRSCCECFSMRTPAGVCL